MKRALYIFILVPVCVLATLVGFYLYSRTEPAFLLKNIKIQGASQFSEAELLQKVSPLLGESIFKTDMEKIKAIVTSNPYVKSVRIKRAFPFSILIDVQERVPCALWVRPRGDVFVLDEQGQSYRRLKKEPTSNMFVITAKGEKDAKSIFKQVKGWVGEGIIGKNFLSEAAYADGNITLFSLDGGVEIILGKEDQTQRLTRAMAVLEDARERGLLIKCVDARFERGAIIKERKEG
jgi:cell division protein FtsQ